MVFNSASAKEWKFIFMGAGYVTGIESEIVTMPLDASDQISFINAGIPAVQLFSGAHRDYHRPSDTVDKIDAGGMVKVAAFVREAIVYLAEREEPLTFLGEEKKESKHSVKKGERKVSTGTMPDFTYSGKGVRIANLSQDSPAAKAGMKKDDVIIKLDKYQVDNLGDYSNALKKYKPGDVVKIIYIRGSETTSTKIKLGAR
jgi:predicted metalloprotease with PDZ domain